MQLKLSGHCLMAASSQFWEQMLGMTLEPAAPGGLIRVGQPHMLGYVILSGSWTGLIEVRLEDRLSSAATAAMLMQPAESLTDADRLDATREIANIIAGVIKSCLPQPCSMSLPEAVLKAGEYVPDPHARDSMAVAFRHGTGDLLVTISETEAEQ
jgi:chemotaxis protein CheX